MRRKGLISLAWLALLAWGVVALIGKAPSALTVSAQANPTTMSYEHVKIPFFESWMGSAHADISSRSFTNWNSADPPLVPVACAKCHSSAGFHDFIGLDGSAAGVVESPAAPGVIQCSTCHNDITVAKTEVTMPSGQILSELSREAVCMECHQGRQSGASVAAAIERSGVVDHDVVMDAQGFLNIHYAAAAATLYGADAGGGFEYPGKVYERRFEHVSTFATCQSCHDPHSLQLDVASCSTCHTGVESVADLRNIRMPGSSIDYDGDGDITTGIYTELYNLRAILFELIQAYADEAIGKPIGYADANPYFFNDLDGDGLISRDEQNRNNAYTTFTPRLLAAAYNYQVAKKDVGGYTHNAKYLIQLVYDSIEDLAGALNTPTMALQRPGDAPIPMLASATTPYSELQASLSASRGVDLGVIERLHRNDSGHFDSTSRAWRNWDAAGAVPASCSTCHSAAGLPFFLQHGVQIAQAASPGMSCTTCHVAEDNFALIELETVRFVSGANASFDHSGDNLCMVCHQGRASGPTLDSRIRAIPDDEVSTSLAFLNIHYAPAAATRFGSDVQGGYQYAGKDYVGYWPHDIDAATCTQCHDPHNGRIDLPLCSDCHGKVETVADIRAFREFSGDFSGDGNTTQGTSSDIQSMIYLLREAIELHARDVIGAPIGYADANPYWFNDLDGDGLISREEQSRNNAYNSFSPRLLRAAYNYQFAKKDKGAYAHNPLYVIQLLHDSLDDLGVDVSNMERPTGY